MGKRKKAPGHFCWVCGRRRPNERFSAKGHRRHVCRECAKLGRQELAYRQHIRHLERCFSFEGFLRRKARAHFERFLQHEDPRVRAEAEALGRRDAEARRLRREAREAEALAWEELHLQWDAEFHYDELESDGARDSGAELDADGADFDDEDLDDIPF